MTHPYQPIQDIINHMKSEYGYEMSEEEVKNMPQGEKVWASWQALAYFKLNDYYRRIEDVPEGTESYHLVEGNQINNYRKFNGEYHLSNQWTLELCKKIYGTDIIG